MKLYKKIKVRCVHNWGNNKPCIISPVYFEPHVGLQWKVVKGEYSGSMFCCKIDAFTINRFWNIVISFIKLHYYIKKDLCKTIRLKLNKKKTKYNIPF